MPIELVTALALVLVIEGAFYALFPSRMKRAIAVLLGVPDGNLRVAGLVAVALGVGIVWLLRG
ncbi:MAG: DUF2065 domain-containing protein [Alphaproteobacteria bacterium]